VKRVRLYATLYSAALQPTGSGFSAGVKALVDLREVMMFELEPNAAVGCDGCTLDHTAEVVRGMCNGLVPGVLARPDVQSVRVAVEEVGDVH
jgi:hypothetical protein